MLQADTSPHCTANHTTDRNTTFQLKHTAQLRVLGPLETTKGYCHPASHDSASPRGVSYCSQRAWQAPLTDIFCSTESEIARVHCHSDMNIEHPVYVHQHLLNGRALNVGDTH
jgi:hypothetical protein